MEKIRKVLNNLFVLITLLIILFILLHFVLPIDLINALSDNFNKMAIGIAALIGSYAGSLYFIEELKRRKLIALYRKKYPHEKYGTEWRQIVREDRTGEPHVLEIDKKIKHHIWNMKTVYDLGWQFYERESVTKEEFDSYKTGDPIRTRGELGE